MRTDQTLPRRVDQPSPGIFLLRLVKGGWPVPARIVYEGGRWHAVVDGVEHASHPDPYAAPWVSRIWEGGADTTQGEYDFRLALKEWMAVHDRRHPCLRPEQPFNLLHVPPVPPHLKPRTP